MSKRSLKTINDKDERAAWAERERFSRAHRDKETAVKLVKAALHRAKAEEIEAYAAYNEAESAWQVHTERVYDAESDG